MNEEQWKQYDKTILSSNLSAISKLIAISLAFRLHQANRMGYPKDYTFITNETIAKDAGVTVRSVTKHKKILSDAGYISVSKGSNNLSIFTCNIT